MEIDLASILRYMIVLITLGERTPLSHTIEERWCILSMCVDDSTVLLYVYHCAEMGNRR